MKRLIRDCRLEVLPFAGALMVQALCFLSQDYRHDAWYVLMVADDERFNCLISYTVILAVLALSSFLVWLVSRATRKPEARYRLAQQVIFASSAVVATLVAFFAICLIPLALELNSDGEWESVQSKSA